MASTKATREARLAELKRKRRVLNGATLTMLFDLLMLWYEEAR